MASSSLRSDPQNWLIGKPISLLSTARLPRMLDVLQLLQFHHLTEGRTLPESYKMTCDAAICIWMRARIPTQRVDSCVRKLSKLHQNYLALKVHRTRKRESDRMKEDMFKGDLQELFDIATKDVMTEIQNEEDREFLRMQREDTFSCSMTGVDVKTASKESRKRQREEKERKVKMRYEERMTKGFNETEGELSSLTSNSESEEDEEYQPTQTQPCTPTTSTSTDSTPGASSSKKKVKNIFQSPEVVGALDRVCLPDRGAVFVAGAVAQALGHDISEITLSRSSIRRSRIKERQRAAAMDEKEFSLAGPLLLHWDGKILPDIDGSKENVDRIAVIVTGNGQEKLLGIPKMDRGTGEAQALLDDRVSASIKEKMVQNLLRPALADIPRRVKLTSESEQLKLEDLVTERTTSFFDVLMEEGKEKSQTFLKKPPGQWTSDPVFKKFYELAAHMTVVNDVAERGISLIEKYNDTLTKNEEQKQFILRLVANHRRNFPTPSKTSLMSSS